MPISSSEAKGFLRSIAIQVLRQNLRQIVISQMKDFYYRDRDGRQVKVNFKEYHAHLYDEPNGYFITIDKGRRCFGVNDDGSLFPVGNTGFSSRPETIKILIDPGGDAYLEDETGNPRRM